VSVPLRPNSSSASPGVVPVVRLGVRCPDHLRSELVGRWCRHGRCDEPATSDVPPPAGVAPPAGVTPPAAGVAPPCGWSAESQPVLVSIVTSQPPQPAVGHLGSRERHRTPSDPGPAGPRWSCRKQAGTKVEWMRKEYLPLVTKRPVVWNLLA
jgi:hypothetical protein